MDVQHTNLTLPTILSTETLVFTDKVTVYPNPASEYVTIHLEDNSGTVSVVLYDTMGRLVSEIYSSEENKITLDVSGFGAGVYYVKISKGKTSTVKRLIIK